MICCGVRLRVMPLMSVGIMLTKLSGTAMNLHIKMASSSYSRLTASHDRANRSKGNQEDVPLMTMVLGQGESRQRQGL